MNEHWAVIPVKGLIESKTRLSTYLGDSRRDFVEALLQDVLSAVVQADVFDKILLLSPDQNVAAQAKTEDAGFLKQTSIGLNRAIEQARRSALREHALSLTTVLADIPLAEPKDFAEIFQMRGTGTSVVLAPSRKMGTNVMLASPPEAVRPRYGRWSYSKHLRQAQAAGIDTYSVSNTRISFDIDTVEDLMRLRRRDPDGQTRSGRVALGLRPILHHARIA